jgi:preprotein translocase subunit SecD
MNRYPIWKYLVIAVVLTLASLYTLPNFFGEIPAVQISSAKPTLKIQPALAQRAQTIVETAKIPIISSQFEPNAIKLRFSNTEDQSKAHYAIEKELNPNPNDKAYVVAYSLLSASPAWLTKIHAMPMYLGLDLRGGVHFLMQVDMKAAVTKRVEALTSDIRSLMREKELRPITTRVGNTIEMKFRDEASQTKARNVLADNQPDLATVLSKEGDDFTISATLKPEAVRATQDGALKQNISTLGNRINELAVSEPVIQQQGIDRIIVQLPGVQDPAKAKEILGRTATLEMRMVCDAPDEISSLQSGTVPFSCERYSNRDGSPIAVRKQVIITGDNLNDAQAGFDSQTQEPNVNLSVDAKGARIIKDVTRENIGKRMAILLIERGKGEVITAPTIRSELGNRFQISGAMNAVEATDTALLLRAGALAAPMEIIEERTIGPSLGKENIEKGLNSTKYGFIAVAVFMCFYYMLFGAFSSLALAINLTLLVALLSSLQATLTLPGMAAIALTLGMAIDSNVLINERIREELRAGKTPQQAISEGYDRAWATILDSNITTLIAGVALWVFGSGAIRGFATVHCLGILTSIFSAVFVSRGIVNLWYGRQKKLSKLSIGTVWKANN